MYSLLFLFLAVFGQLHLFARLILGRVPARTTAFVADTKHTSLVLHSVVTRSVAGVAAGIDVFRFLSTRNLLLVVRLDLGILLVHHLLLVAHHVRNPHHSHSWLLHTHVHLVHAHARLLHSHSVHLLRVHAGLHHLLVVHSSHHVGVHGLTRHLLLHHWLHSRLNHATHLLVGVHARASHHWLTGHLLHHMVSRHHSRLLHARLHSHTRLLLHHRLHTRLHHALLLVIWVHFINYNSIQF